MCRPYICGFASDAMYGIPTGVALYPDSMYGIPTGVALYPDSMYGIPTGVALYPDSMYGVPTDVALRRMAWTASLGVLANQNLI